MGNGLNDGSRSLDGVTRLNEEKEEGRTSELLVSLDEGRGREPQMEKLRRTWKIPDPTKTEV